MVPVEPEREVHMVEYRLYCFAQMRIPTALALFLLAAATAVYGETEYTCTCCAAYFGKDPDAPSYFGSGAGYGRLVKRRRYEEVVSRFNDAFRKKDYTLSDVGWMGEAMYALGAIKYGRHNPLQPYFFYQEEKPKDPIAHDLWWMREKYGGRIWDRTAIETYGRPALCAAGEVRKAYPNVPRFAARHLSILIATGEFDELQKEVAALDENSLRHVTELGEFLAKLMREFVGMARYEEGAAFLAAIKKHHGLSKATQEHWVQRLLRGVEAEPLPAAEKKRLRLKILTIRATEQQARS